MSADGKVEQIALPGAGRLDLLASDPATGVLGFTFTSAEPVDDSEIRAYFGTLFTVDQVAGRTPVPVSGLNGVIPEVTGWGFVPITGDLVVYSVAISLVDGTIDRLDPSRLEGEVPYGGMSEVVLGGGWVQVVADVDALTGRSKTAVVYDDGEAACIINRTVDDEGSFVSFSLSPNNQYLASETVPSVTASVSDGYVVDPRSTSITTVYLEVATGAVVRSVDGFAVSW